MRLLCLSLLLIFISCTAAPTQAKVWHTKGQGYWQYPYTWVDNQTPPYQSSDTFYIHHPIIFEQSIALHSGAYMHIDSTGGLCGHHNMDVHSGASLLKYGLLELDTMFVPGGQVRFKLPKEVIFWQYARITNGGSLQVDSCSLAVGPWFQCKLPEYAFQAPSAVSAITAPLRFRIHPNPTNGTFTVSGSLASGTIALLQLSDLSGRPVYTHTLQGTANSWQIHSHLALGLYNWRIYSSDGSPEQRGSLVISP